jgi:hypothetical protein
MRRTRLHSRSSTRWSRSTDSSAHSSRPGWGRHRSSNRSSTRYQPPRGERPSPGTSTVQIFLTGQTALGRVSSFLRGAPRRPVASAPNGQDRRARRAHRRHYRRGDLLRSHRRQLLDVIDALIHAWLSTTRKPLGHFSPPSSNCATFCSWTREQGLDPTDAQGLLCRVPWATVSSCPAATAAYAVDFDGDGLADIWNNPVDAIGSVANYLSAPWLAAPAKPVVSGCADAGAELPATRPGSAAA